MLKYRLLFGPVLILVILLTAWLDQRLQGVPLPDAIARLWPGPGTFPPGVVIFVVVVAASVLASRELTRIMRDNGIKTSKRITTTAALVGLVVSCLVPSEIEGERAVAVVSTAAVAVLLLALAYYSRHKSFEGIVAAAGGTLLAFVYLGLMFGFLLAVRREHSAWVVIWVLLVTKSCDIGAYFTGRAIGRHKLIVWLSPGKTWEGLAGGMVLAAVVAALGAMALERGGETMPGPLMVALGGAVLGVVGQMGDLIASLFKRDAGIKDSSSILPGFGGVLDVLDSMLLAFPVAYWWLVVLRGE